jgi:hypothetical protein
MDVKTVGLGGTHGVQRFDFGMFPIRGWPSLLGGLVATFVRVKQMNFEKFLYM